ncbi:MAG TPA: DAK2 domain-containing protein [Eubacteriales bacterium]|jgi:DAK2 domain fusion protein YloV|nr:DAK2 domain-containing protein [Eubacteriales bacterium]HRU84549.1 DAK2 domain-containing protein [Eubacteriales bacterium]
MIEIDSNFFVEIAKGGYRYLSFERKLVDSLNVFPVPDGDTGTNMSLTMLSAVNEAEKCESAALSDIVASFSRGALRGARGNSGVILSQIFKGFVAAVSDKETLNAKTFAEALQAGTEIAYSAVTKPKEGTILTVVRVMAETAYALTKRKTVELEPFFEAVLASGEEVLAKTPEMLPVLKKANVVDAGGKGLLSIIKGFQCVILGKEIPSGEADVELAGSEKAAADDADESDSLKFAYCTELLVTRLLNNVTVADIDKLRDKLLELGDCVLVIGDLNLVKVHVHTNNPDKVLKAALSMGEIDGIKIENMLEQHRKLHKDEEPEEEQHEKKEYGLIGISVGEGFSKIFADFSVDKIVEGGQTMNPSVKEILNAINEVNAKNVYIFPNNPNIILAANQAKELADCNVFVIPTMNIPQGIAAVLAFLPSESPEENQNLMLQAIKRVKCGQVTHAVRNARMSGFSVKEGDIIGFSDKNIVAKGDSVDKVMMDTLAALVSSGSNDVVSIYYGADVKNEQAEALAATAAEAYPDLEVMFYYGGQPHYYYILAVE